ncbi:MAG TPA: rhamnogalacturonan acetylesterase [Flavilitoribacter sp.]|nr:rhamnogalacturonan acetylesterase [Flavilitoribacter sp.]
MFKRLPPVIGLILTLLAAISWKAPDPVLTLFMIGDSTMADKADPDRNPEVGWGQVMPEFFTDQVQVRNFAVNGRSTRSFIDEGRWDNVLKDLRPGDYVFIQFGHNDQKVNDPKRYTNPWTGYRRNLERFVKEAREKGGVPVILSSIVRRKFNENGTLEDTHGVYPFVARQVAADLDVPFIDLQLKTEDLVASMGPEKSKELYLWLDPGQDDYFPDGKQDDTHLNIRGAREFARLATDAIKAMELPLADYLK